MLPTGEATIQISEPHPWDVFTSKCLRDTCHPGGDNLTLSHACGMQTELQRAVLARLFLSFPSSPTRSLLSLKTAFWETRFLDMSEDKLSLASQVCSNKLSLYGQANNSQDLLGDFSKKLLKKSAAFTVTYDRRTNLANGREGVRLRNCSDMNDHLLLLTTQKTIWSFFLFSLILVTCNPTLKTMYAGKKNTMTFFFSWQQHAGAMRGEQMDSEGTEMNTAGQE